MASEAISEHLIKKKNWGEHAPDPPSVRVLTYAPSSVPPQPQVPSAASEMYYNNLHVQCFFLSGKLTGQKHNVDVHQQGN